MAEQIFLSPKVKRSMIVSNKLVYTRYLTSYQEFVSNEVKSAFNEIKAIAPLGAKIRHCVKSARIWSSSGPYPQHLDQIWRDTEYPPRIQPKCRKIRTRRTPNTDTFHTVWDLIPLEIQQKKYINKHLGMQ